jgi:hypothetical protein
VVTGGGGGASEFGAAVGMQKAALLLPQRSCARALQRVGNAQRARAGAQAMAEWTK